MKIKRKKIGSFNIIISASKTRQKYELWLIYYKNLKHFKFRFSYLEIQIWKNHKSLKCNNYKINKVI